MKAPSEQWAVQIDVTNACPNRCSNCTRLTAHVRKPFFMTPECFREACESVATFPEDSVPDVQGRRKVIGMIGGEPTIHPQFEHLCEVMADVIPDRASRGLWSSLGPAYDRHADMIDAVFGYQNKHPHQPPARHQPVLVASEELMPDRGKRYALIRDCWLQNSWCGAITPKGVFFCEVAAALDMIFDGPGGLPIEPMWWNRSLLDFHDQINRWCNRCGVCMPLPGRMDCDEMDDVTPGNMAALEAVGSRALARCRVFPPVGYDPDTYAPEWEPRRYRDLTKGQTMGMGTMDEPMKQSEVQERWQFGLLCNARGLMWGNAVEVGTDRGDFAVRFLRCWRGATLDCVDPYVTYAAMNHDREADRQIALAQLAPFGARVRFRRETSEAAAPRVPKQIVFVYIDGDHHEEAVSQDCALWWDRLAPNGILAGHDINKAPVLKAVTKFASEVERPVWKCGDRVGYSSWYIYREPDVEPFSWCVGGWLGRRDSQ